MKSHSFNAIDSLLANVLGTTYWILYWQMYCWLAGCRLLAAFAFFLLFLSFPFLSFAKLHGKDQDFSSYSGKAAAKINQNDQIFGISAYQTDRDHKDHRAFAIEICQILRSQKG